MVALVRERLGDDLASSVLVGDRASTDGAMAEALGVPFVLVRTGISGGTTRGDVGPRSRRRPGSAAVAQ